MNFIKKLYKYFFYNPLEKLIFNHVSKLNDKNYVFIFNLYSFYHCSKDRILKKQNGFFLKETNWKFTQKKAGLYFYGKSLKKRKAELQKTYFLNNIDLIEDDIIIDIGANNGDLFLCFDKKINYYAFEPSPTVFSNLENNVKNQFLFNKAVHKENFNDIEFFISDEWGDSSVIPIENYTKKILIKTIKLDDILKKINSPVKFLKIEAEGLEPEILEGLKESINFVKYISIDCGFERGIEKKSTIAECSNYLINNGFKMLDFGAPRIVCLFKNNKFKD